MKHHAVIVIGAGPAGLSATHELAASPCQPVLVLDQADKVGGIARTESHQGYHFDIGGHRFFTRVHSISHLWQQMLADDFRTVSRLSRIYYRRHFYDYPLNMPNTLTNLGIGESALVLLSFLEAQLRPKAPEFTFEQWVTKRFGRRLYERFFKTYTEKVWGMPGDGIQADWAAQRIGGLSFGTVVANSLLGTNQVKTLISEFSYPRRGPGMMWQRFREVSEAAGASFELGQEVVQLIREGSHVVRAVTPTGSYTGDHFISSMPITDLIARLSPPPPPAVLAAAAGLKYRAFAIVCLIVDEPSLFPDNWLYIHSPEVLVGRIQNYKNWSPAMVPDPGTTSLGMEYFCSEGDAIWSLPEQELRHLAAQELQRLGLANADRVIGGAVFRQPKAYPVYDDTYRQHLDVVRSYLATLRNLQTVGRAGMHRYNNMDHSMLTGSLAARNILGEAHDLWAVNADQTYHESHIPPQSNK